MTNIINLTNSVWKFIYTLNFDENIEINVNFSSNNSEYDKIVFEKGTGLIYIKNANPNVVYSILDGVGSWSSEEVRTITINGGPDVENSDAINTLKGMAEYVSGGEIEETEYKTLDEFFTAVGDAIRAKKGTTDKIKRQNIPNEILSIEVIPDSLGTLKITENGIFDVKGYEKVDVDIPTPQTYWGDYEVL